MSDYKREVYYLYNYENRRKKNNIGFARIEQMNGQCRITVRMRVMSMNGKTLDVCLFVRECGEIRFLPIGTIKINNMAGECRLRLNAENILESGYSLGEMEGMVIYDSIEKFFGSEWKEQKIYFEEFKTISGKKQLESSMDGTNETNETDEEKAEEWETKSMERQEQDAKREGAADDDEKQEEETVPVVENKQEEQLTAAGLECGTERSLSKRLPEIFYQCERLNPFEDDEITDCIKIEPQDIGRLPMESWILANNSFLLHSYYSYRHLLLARRACGVGFEYVLCAPGICQNREEFMAAMFGFCDFKPVKKVEDKTGEFGYWYMPVVMEET
jgi:hypothetical protein